MVSDEEDGYELHDGTACAVQFVFNHLVETATVARVRLADGSTIPGSMLVRADWFYLLGQFRERHMRDDASP